MKTATSKGKSAVERLEARVPVRIKSLIDRAAALEGRTLTDYVIATLEKDAARVVKEHDILHLSVADSKAFAAAMIKPPSANSKLRQAMAKHSKSVSME